jgi:hypothetical protein
MVEDVRFARPQWTGVWFAATSAWGSDGDV